MMVLKLCKRNCQEELPTTIAEELGQGADGQVFAVENDPSRVYKFCILFDKPLDQNYQRIVHVLSYLHDNPSPAYAHVYEYKYMGEWVRPEDKVRYALYSYTMERLQKLSEDERKVFHTILSHEDRNIVKDYSTNQLQEILLGLSKGLDFDMEKVIVFRNNLKNTPIDHNDLHPRNIMKDAEGNFKLIDFDRATLEKR